MGDRVNVLLSTYNGAKFMIQQLDSVSNQSYKNIVIHIRDDGSTDETPNLLKSYAKGYSNIEVVYGQNLGVFKTFLKLLCEADEGSSFYAFCDQDDIWLKDKLKNAISAIKTYDQSQPIMYCSRIEYVDEKLNHLGYSRIPEQINFANALVENVVSGCTVVLNRKARELILANVPNTVYMHDWWFYLVISAFGKIFYDNNIYIKYRLHENNAAGAGTNLIQQMIRRSIKLIKKKNSSFIYTMQLKQFQKCFASSLDKQNLQIIHKFLNSKKSFWTRLRYAFCMEVYKQSWVDNLLLRIQIIMGSY